MGVQFTAHNDATDHFRARDLHHLKLYQAIVEEVDQHGCAGGTSAAMA